MTAMKSCSFRQSAVGEAERLRHAMTAFAGSECEQRSWPWGERQDGASKRMSREGERRELERAAGLLGERWMREPSNRPNKVRRQ